VKQPKTKSFQGSFRSGHSKSRGFTILEVVIASSVMVLVISSAIVVLQQGMRAIDTARYTTLAGQILQSQMEKVRMLNWNQFTYINSSTTPASGGPLNYATFTTDVSSANAQINRFTFTQTITRTTGALNPSLDTTKSAQYNASVNTDIYDIVLTAAWTGVDGQPHSLSYTTRYLKNGLSSFFYVTTPRN
jgi:type II secretory pathway pseudopilin PulG